MVNLSRAGRAAPAAWIWALLLVGAAAPSCGGDGGGSGGSTNPTTINGSGIIIEEERPVEGITGIAMFSVGSVYIEQGLTERLVVSGEDNILPHVTTEVVDGVLEIRPAGNVSLNTNHAPEFFVTVITLEEVRRSGVGGIVATGLRVPSLAVSSSGFGRTALYDLIADTLAVTSTGVGNIEASGAVDTQELFITGFGDYDGRDLQCATAEVELASMGAVTVWVTDLLVVTITGSGSVYYIGNPVIESTITGTGSVAPLN